MAETPAPPPLLTKSKKKTVFFMTPSLTGRRSNILVRIFSARAENDVFALTGLKMDQIGLTYRMKSAKKVFLAQNTCSLRKIFFGKIGEYLSLFT